VHVTLLSIEYSAEDRAFNGFLKVYYDDFLLDYRLFSGNLASPDVKSPSDEEVKMIAAYINERIHFIAGGKKVMARIKDMSLSDNELKMNLRFMTKKRQGKYRIGNSILADIYRDQTNLLIFRCDDFEEGIKLTYDNREYIFDVK
jgi:hypothetical protein